MGPRLEQAVEACRAVLQLEERTPQASPYWHQLAEQNLSRVLVGWSERCPNEVTRPLARKRVTVFDYPDGRLAIKHNGRELPYRTFDRRQQVNQAAVVENKRLGPVLAYIAERQKELDMGRSKKAPRRRGQGPSLFKVG